MRCSRGLRIPPWLVGQSFFFFPYKSFRKEKKGGQSHQEREQGVDELSHAEGSPLFEECSVHGEAQNRTHRGTNARSQPEGGVLQIRLSHVSEEGGAQRQDRASEKRKDGRFFTTEGLVTK